MDASNTSVSSYGLSSALETCIPLPDELRSNISQLAIVAINAVNPSVSYLSCVPRRDEALRPRVPGGRISGPNRGRADNHRVRLKDLMPSRRIFGLSVRRRVMTSRCRCLGSGPGWRTLGPKVGTEFAVTAVETNCIIASRLIDQHHEICHSTVPKNYNRRVAKMRMTVVQRHPERL